MDQPELGLYAEAIAQGFIPRTPVYTQGGVRVVMFDDHPVRTGGDPRNPWFCVLDLLRALDDDWYDGKRYSPNKAAKVLKPEEGILIPLFDPNKHKRNTQCVYKSGVFHLIGNSNKPSALKFKEWLRREVLPEIDETGGYKGAPGAVIRAPATMKEALQVALSEMEQKKPPSNRCSNSRSGTRKTRRLSPRSRRPRTGRCGSC